MARYRARRGEVHAEPYRPGLEDEVCHQAGPVLVTPAGRLPLAPGDWIVTRETGEREVVKAHVFDAAYEACQADGMAATHGRVRRGLPMRSG